MLKGLYILILVPFLSVLLVNCKKESVHEKLVKREMVKNVTLKEVKPEEVDELHEVSGRVTAKSTIVVSSRVTGEVTSLKVREGSRVKKGDLLLIIDDRDMREKAAGAEAGHRESLKAFEAVQKKREFTEITFRRYRQLFENKAISQQEMDQVETNRRLAYIEYEQAQERILKAKAGLAEVKTYQGYSRITAPVAGVITEKMIENGGMAMPGVPLLKIEDISSFIVEFDLDESLSGKVKEGKEVEIEIKSLNRNIKGIVKDILPTVDAASRQFLVKVLVEGKAAEGLKSGSYAKILFPGGKKKVILVPENAIAVKGQLTGVYIVNKEGLVTYRLIRTGKKYQGNVEVISGVDQGEIVISDGVSNAVDGGIVSGADIK